MASTADDLLGPASLAEEFALLLTGPPKTPPQAMQMGDFRDGPPLPAMPDQEKQRVRNLLEKVKLRAEHSGLLGRASGPPSVVTTAPVDQEAIIARRGLPYFVPPVGPLATRIRALIDWVKRQVAVASLFIVDAQGCPVTDAEPTPEILATAVLLADAARRASQHLPTAGEGALHVDLPSAQKLCIIHTETTYGHFCLGLVTAEALPSASADRLRRALQRTVEADGETGPVG